MKKVYFLSLLMVLALMSGCARKAVTASAPAYDGGEVRFRFDSDTLLPQYKALLDRSVEYLNSHPGSVIVLEGHTDAPGTDVYNMDLGDKRARTVKAYLLGKGVDADRIVTLTYGEKKASGQIGTEQRRVSIHSATQ